MRGLALLVVAAVGGAAIAAPETGTHVDRMPMAPTTEQQDNPDAAARVLNGLGRCQAHLHPRPATAILALPFAEEAQGQAAAKMFGGIADCMGTAYGQIRFTATLVVGAMAEQLIADHRPRIDLGTSLPGAHPATPRNALEDVGDCVIGRDPQNALAVLQSKPASPQEKTGIASLKPAIGECLPANQTFRLSLPMIRSLIAVSSYRRLIAAGA